MSDMTDHLAPLPEGITDAHGGSPTAIPDDHLIPAPEPPAGGYYPDEHTGPQRPEG